MKTPICPVLLYFKGDEHKCNTSKCNYDKKTKTCSMGCKSMVLEEANDYKYKEITAVVA